MNGFLIFLAVALWFGLSVRKAYRKQVSELKSDTASDEGTVKSTFESLFDESRKQSVGSMGSSTFASEAASAGYYSYETASSSPRESATPFTARPTQRAPKAARPADMQEEVGTPTFDLRQAVVYQTILTNKYISDMHSYDN